MFVIDKNDGYMGKPGHSQQGPARSYSDKVALLTGLIGLVTALAELVTRLI